jgi:ElaB/YqjD/DUF883 family membrane-anchored ribosome-binding protein
MPFFSRHRSEPEHGNGIHVTAMRETAAEFSAEAGRRLADAGDEARKRLSGAEEFVKTIVTNQPALALGVALAAGVFIGWLIKRR